MPTKKTPVRRRTCRSRRGPKRTPRKEWLKATHVVSVVYHGYDYSVQRALEEAAGRRSDGSGFLFAGGLRDLDWYSSSAAAAQKVYGRLSKAISKRTGDLAHVPHGIELKLERLPPMSIAGIRQLGPISFDADAARKAGWSDHLLTKAIDALERIARFYGPDRVPLKRLRKAARKRKKKGA